MRKTTINDVQKLPIGEALSYHIGFLAIDRSNDKELDALSDYIMREVDKRNLTAFQEKITQCCYNYIVQRLPGNCKILQLQK